MSHTPTNEELNRLTAEVCGWRWYHHNALPTPRADGKEEAFLLPPHYRENRVHLRYAENRVPLIEGEPPPPFVRIYGQPVCPIPDYCGDRNALDELLDVIERQQLWPAFLGILNEYCDSMPYHMMPEWKRHRAKPRLQVIAALRSLGRWPEGWRAQQEPHAP